MCSSRSLRIVTILSATVFLGAPLAGAQNARPDGPMQTASRLDSEGRTREARAIFQQVIDTASTPAAKAAAQRAMAISYAFDGDCGNTVRFEEMVIAYWKTRDPEEPQNAFYQQGEMANEAARVCIDAGQLDVAEKYYRLGTELGMREPEPKLHPASLWDFRLAHALARLAARRGDNDPFMHALLGMTHEKMGEGAKAKALYEKAYGLATAHNPPAAFSRPFARRKMAADTR